MKTDYYNIEKEKLEERIKILENTLSNIKSKIINFDKLSKYKFNGYFQNTLYIVDYIDKILKG